MPLSHEEKAFRTECSHALKDEWVAPNDPRYVEIFGQLPDVDDPVELLATEISDSGSESLQFLSGFRGSGKTTQLRRLQSELETDPDGNTVVLYADALEYFHPTEPLEITQFLLAFAGAFAEAVAERFGSKNLRESWLTRFTNFLTDTEVEITGGKVSASYGTPLKPLLGEMKASAELSAALRQTPSFVQKVNALLRDRLSQLRAAAEEFIEGCLKEVRRHQGEHVRIVFIFDQMEQIGAASANASAAVDSLRRLYSHHREMLRFSGVHLVYAVPPWVPFALPRFAGLVPIPSIKCWHRDTRAHCAEGLEILREILRRRLTDARIARLFGTAPGSFPSALDKIVQACGGDIRGLLRLARGILQRTTELPVPASAVDRTIINARDGFTIVADDEAIWLDRIGREHAPAVEERTIESINRFTLLLDNYFVVCFRNGEVWYDLHPLVRENVEAYMQRIRARPAEPAPSSPSPAPVSA